jgi:hypothetical protein
MNKSLERVVEPELLDVLPPQDRRALRSRLDLRRLNKWMNHPRVMTRALSENLAGIKAPRIAELGAGDGDFLLSIARRLKKQWPAAQATLVDRLEAFDPEIQKSFNDLGWRVRTEIADVSDWLRQLTPDAADAIIANLFLHQFQRDALAEMLRLAAHSTKVFIALEPRRSWLSRLCGHFLWCIGCSRVTCHDGRISIRAGFLGPELSALWPDDKQWDLDERPVGLFSHLFIARRKD